MHRLSLASAQSISVSSSRCTRRSSCIAVIGIYLVCARKVLHTRITLTKARRPGGAPMNGRRISTTIRVLAFGLSAAAFGLLVSLMAQAQPQPAANDPVRQLVGHLDLAAYKATIKGLTQFGDRREGTARNRAAVDWIEAQLKSYGCTNTERIKYTYNAPPPAASTQSRPPPNPVIASG